MRPTAALRDIVERQRGRELSADRQTDLSARKSARPATPLTSERKTRHQAGGFRINVTTRLIWDNHGCPPSRPDAGWLAQLERYRSAGVTVVSLNIGYAGMSAHEHLANLSFMRGSLAQWPDRYRLIAHVADIQRCRQDGKLGLVFDVEGMGPVQHEPWHVQTFYELGVRWMLIAYNQNNEAGGGCLDEDRGLTAVGRTLIDEMERVGMVLCLSHAGERTVLDALDYARQPPIFSHSNPSGDFAHARNISDRVMRACAAKGGVIGLSGIGPFLGVSERLAERLLRQLLYVIDLVGPAHVGIGLDFVFDASALDAAVRANPALYPAEIGGSFPMLGPEALSDIAEHLTRAGLHEDEIRGVLGENWLRIATRVWH
jgi:membrane dipeptidase